MTFSYCFSPIQLQPNLCLADIKDQNQKIGLFRIQIAQALSKYLSDHFHGVIEMYIFLVSFRFYV